jgi:predicted transcriptional regulator
MVRTLDNKKREPTMPDKHRKSNVLELTAQIVSAHVANNPVDTAALPSVIRTVFDTLVTIGDIGATPATAVALPTEKPQPAVPIRKSVFPDYIVCLEDGKRLKMLKRHLATTFNLTPTQYRLKWGLDVNYPMVAPNYAEANRPGHTGPAYPLA